MQDVKIARKRAPTSKPVKLILIARAMRVSTGGGGRGGEKGRSETFCPAFGSADFVDFDEGDAGGVVRAADLEGVGTGAQAHGQRAVGAAFGERQ